MNKQYRQGDVMIERVDELPARARRKKDNGRVILALGEVTGHHHSFVVEDAARFEGESGEEYFRVSGRALDFEGKLVRRWRGQVLVEVPGTGLVEFAAGDVEVTGESVRVSGRFGLLEHQEHTVQAIPAGLYKGASAGATVRQREYSPEAIRNVAD